MSMITHVREKKTFDFEDWPSMRIGPHENFLLYGIYPHKAVIIVKFRVSSDKL
jgi:hypothetical protein